MLTTMEISESNFIGGSYKSVSQTLEPIQCDQPDRSIFEQPQ